MPDRGLADRAAYYSEFALYVRAPIFSAPVLLVAAPFSAWPQAVALWLFASNTAYLYGRWVRDDDDESA